MNDNFNGSSMVVVQEREKGRAAQPWNSDGAIRAIRDLGQKIPLGGWALPRSAALEQFQEPGIGFPFGTARKLRLRASSAFRRKPEMLEATEMDVDVCAGRSSLGCQFFSFASAWALQKNSP